MVIDTAPINLPTIRSQVRNSRANRYSKWGPHSFSSPPLIESRANSNKSQMTIHYYRPLRERGNPSGHTSPSFGSVRLVGIKIYTFFAIGRGRIFLKIKQRLWLSHCYVIQLCNLTKGKNNSHGNRISRKSRDLQTTALLIETL